MVLDIKFGCHLCDLCVLIFLYFIHFTFHVYMKNGKGGKGRKKKQTKKVKSVNHMNRLFHSWIYFCNCHFSNSIIFKWQLTSWQLPPPLWAQDDRMPRNQAKNFVSGLSWSASFTLLLESFLVSSAFLWVSFTILGSRLSNYHKMCIVR